FARRSVDTDHPQPAEVALLSAPADEGVLQCGVDRLLRSPIELALVGVIALGQAEQLLPLGAPDCSSLYTRHCRSPTVRLKPDTTSAFSRESSAPGPQSRRVTCREASAPVSRRRARRRSSCRAASAFDASSCCSGCAA